MPNKPTIDKLERMMKGERVVCSETDLDLLSPFDASNVIRSIPNPNRVGLKDAYECWIEQRDIDRLNNS